MGYYLIINSSTVINFITTTVKIFKIEASKTIESLAIVVLNNFNYSFT